MTEKYLKRRTLKIKEELKKNGHLQYVEVENGGFFFFWSDIAFAHCPFGFTCFECRELIFAYKPYNERKRRIQLEYICVVFSVRIAFESN